MRRVVRRGCWNILLVLKMSTTSRHIACVLIKILATPLLFTVDPPARSTPRREDKASRKLLGMQVYGLKYAALPGADAGVTL